MNYVITLHASADSDITPEQMREEIYDAMEDVPFGFDVILIEENR